MNNETALLKRVRDTLLGLKETHYDLYWDIQTALDHPSLDLRDHFAGLAMQGLLKRINIEEGCFTIVAVDAYIMANAMLKAREAMLKARGAGDES